MARTDTAARIIAASPDLVYDALVNPEALVAWLPPSGMTGRMDYFDARAGGSYRMELIYSDPSAQGKSTAGTDVVEVRYVEIRPGVRVIQAVDFVSDDPSFSGTMTMTWSVTPHGNGTLMEIRAEDVPAGISASDHAEGLASSLANLAAYVEHRC